MAGAQVTFHGCRSINTVRHSPDNANAISLAVERGGDWRGGVELLMFDLPTSETDKLHRLDWTDADMSAIRTCLSMVNQMAAEDIKEHTDLEIDEWSNLLQKVGVAGDVAPDSPAAREPDVTMSQEKAEFGSDDLGESPDY